MSIAKTNDQAFKALLDKHDKVLIKFYADWCGSCKLIAPKIRRMSEKDEYADVAFLDVNAEENPELRKWAKVDNLPFFAAVKNGEIVNATFTAKPDTVESMVQLLNK